MAAKQKMQTVDEAVALEQALGLAHKDVTVRGEVIRVEEFEIGHLPILIKTVRDLAGGLSAGVTTDALLRSGETGIQIAMLATGKPREWFNRLPLGDGLALYAAIIEANTSFFTHLPELTDLVQLAGALLPPMKTSGPASSASSPATDSLLEKSDG